MENIRNSSEALLNNTLNVISEYLVWIRTDYITPHQNNAERSIQEKMNNINDLCSQTNTQSLKKIIEKGMPCDVNKSNSLNYDLITEFVNLLDNYVEMNLLLSLKRCIKGKMSSQLLKEK